MGWLSWGAKRLTAVPPSLLCFSTSPNVMLGFAAAKSSIPFWESDSCSVDSGEGVAMGTMARAFAWGAAVGVVASVFVRGAFVLRATTAATSVTGAGRHAGAA